MLFGLIRLLRIPRIIATLSGSLIVMSVSISVGRGLKIKPPPVFSDLVALRVLGVPLVSGGNSLDQGEEYLLLRRVGPGPRRHAIANTAWARAHPTKTSPGQGRERFLPTGRRCTP